MRLVLALLLSCSAAAVPIASQRDASTAPKIFVFEQPFYVNLHHFLYVLGRAENRVPDRERRAVADAPRDQAAGLGSLTTEEQAIWRAAVTEYAGSWSKKDTVFDTDLSAFTHSLVRATSAPNDLLRRVEPLYRKAWWPAHSRANDARIREIQQLVDQHGSAVLAYLTSRYQETWPAAGYPINVSGYTNWAGAYSTNNNLLVVSSLDPGQSGLAGLEILFHESMHQWDGAMQARLKAAADRTRAAFPGNLSHAMVFYTAGEAVRSVVRGYTPYADAQGVWARGMSALKPVLDQAWKPYLNGSGTLDAALDAIMRQLQ